MSTAGLRLLAGRFVSLQDGGRVGHTRHGVGHAGAMDPLGRRHALRLAGVGPDDLARTTAIEVGPDGARVAAVRAAVDLAIAGPGAVVRIGGDRVEAPAVVRLEPDDTLEIDGGARWTSLCAVGRLVVDPVLGSTSRHERSGLGPTWRVGEVVQVVPPRDGAAVALGSRPSAAAAQGPLLLLPGPQTHTFLPEVRQRLEGDRVRISSTGDRTAQRLDGVTLPATAGHDIVSDGVVVGAVQVQGDGAPWVLLAEHQPTGGYPKIGVVAAADRCRLVQLPPGSPVRLRWGDAAGARRRWDAAVAAIERSVAGPVTPTADRLRRGEVAGDVDDVGPV